MSQKPWESNPESVGQEPHVGQPTPLEYATPPKIGLNLKRIATRQRAINLCILVEIFLLVAQIGARGSGIPPLALLILLAYWAVAITGSVFLFMLAVSLYNTGAGIVLGILSLIPLLGLIFLLMVNGRATRVLRQHGIRVGLLGANPSTIPA